MIEVHRFPDGKLVSRGETKFKWARITRAGKVHQVVGVIFRWNFNGGTRDKPDITYVMACGPQRHTVLIERYPRAIDICTRCDNNSITTGEGRNRDHADH